MADDRGSNWVALLEAAVLVLLLYVLFAGADDPPRQTRSQSPATPASSAQWRQQ